MPVTLPHSCSVIPSFEEKKRGTVTIRLEENKTVVV
ncbi:hypothetical protein T09_8161 [Trichinella sp. T9]|nr:hypothetical protein T09_8161 [Trichinella sp. T9]